MGNKKEINIEDIFLNIGKRDIKTANLLFEMQRFPEAIYYLQQANEKIIKSFGIGLGIITEKEAKSEVSHNTWKFLKFFYIYLKKYINVSFPDEEQNNKQIEKYLKEVNKKFIDFRINILTDELDFIFNKNKFNERLVKSITDFSDKSFWLDVSANILLNIFTSRKDIKDFILPMFKMVYIGIMLSNHNQSSRYPFKLKNKTIEPHTYYNKQNPLVKKYKLIEKTMKTSILIVEEAFANMDLLEINLK